MSETKSRWASAVSRGENYNLYDDTSSRKAPTSKPVMAKNGTVKVGDEVIPVSYDKGGQAYLFINGSASPIPKGVELPAYLAELKKKGKKYDSYMSMVD